MLASFLCDFVFFVWVVLCFCFFFFSWGAGRGQGPGIKKTCPSHLRGEDAADLGLQQIQDGVPEEADSGSRHLDVEVLEAQSLRHHLSFEALLRLLKRWLGLEGGTLSIYFICSWGGSQNRSAMKTDLVLKLKQLEVLPHSCGATSFLGPPERLD